MRPIVKPFQIAARLTLGKRVRERAGESPESHYNQQRSICCYVEGGKKNVKNTKEF